MGPPNSPDTNIDTASLPAPYPPDTTPEHAPSPEVVAAAATPTKPGFLRFLASHPPGFWFIFWGEFAERCSYYGMRAILAVYMADRLGLGQADSGTYMSFFIAACYFLPLLGGYVADNFFGKYWTIVGFSLPYIVGQLILGIENPVCLFIALTLLAMGSGVIKPNISTLMGMTYDQQRPGQEQLRSTAFSMFYMAINIGAGISQFVMPLLRNEYGYLAAFMFPAALMLLAFIIFALGKPFYAKEVISRTPSTPEERSLKLAVLGRISGLFLLVMFFWAIFDQSASTWIFFANKYMDTNLLGLTVTAEQIQALNAVLIVLLLPFVTTLWVYLDRRGLRVRATDKMVIGFLLTAACMGVMALAALQASETEKVSLMWQAFAYLLLTVAEILISVTGLELAFVAAPQSMKSFVTGMWLVTVGMANLFINAPVTRLYPMMPPATYFAGLAVTLLVVTVAFVFVARRFNQQKPEPKAPLEAGRAPSLPPGNGEPPSEHITARQPN